MKSTAPAPAPTSNTPPLNPPAQVSRWADLFKNAAASQTATSAVNGKTEASGKEADRSGRESQHVEAAKIRASPPCAGILERAPGSWLYLLLGHMSPKDKLGLFKTSRLAKLVVHHSPKVRLTLKGSRSAFATEKARRTLTQLLKGCKHLEVHAELQYGQQPLPAVPIHSLTLEGPDADKNSYELAKEWLQLSQLSTVEVLYLRGIHNEKLEAWLCAALEKGAMPHLHTLVSDNIAKGLLLPERFASALGSRVKVMRMREGSTLMQHLHLFKSLHSVQLYRCPLGKQVMQQLCDHPTLHTVIMDNCKRNCREWDCNFRTVLPKCWKTLVFRPDRYFSGMYILPVKYLQEVIIQKSSLLLDEEDDMILSELLDLGDKLIWEPESSKLDHVYFQEVAAGRDALQIITHFRSKLSPTVVFHIKGRVSRKARPLLPEAWQFIPACVSCMHITDAGVFSGSGFWQGMPLHVTKVYLHFWWFDQSDAVPLETVRMLISTAPLHMQRLVIAYVDQCPCTENIPELQSAAPLHVTLVFHEKRYSWDTVE